MLSAPGHLAMVLIANGKIPFDPANPSGSVKMLSRHLEALETELHGASLAFHNQPSFFEERGLETITVELLVGSVSSLG